MNLTIDTARRWAEEILRQLGDPEGHTLSVLAAGPEKEFEAPGSEAVFESSFQVEWDDEPAAPEPTSESASAPDDAATGSGVDVWLGLREEWWVGVRLDASLSEADAVALLADQMQDEVPENTHGTPVPPCPGSGHGHPLTADVVDGVACWVCPRGDGIAPQPILH
jgi:hypothetical protein